MGHGKWDMGLVRSGRRHSWDGSPSKHDAWFPWHIQELELIITSILAVWSPRILLSAHWALEQLIWKHCCKHEGIDPQLFTNCCLAEGLDWSSRSLTASTVLLHLAWDLNCCHSPGPQLLVQITKFDDVQTFVNVQRPNCWQQRGLGDLMNLVRGVAELLRRVFF